MEKAKFVRRLKGYFDYRTRTRQNDILVYEYRGYEYDIEDIPTYQQTARYFQNAHREEQSRIDRIIQCKEQRENSHFDINKELDEIFKMLEWD